MAGWIKISRDIAEHWVFSDAEYFKRWVDLLVIANYEKSKILINGNLIDIGRGQLAWSQETLAKRWKCTRQNVRTLLNNLEKDGMILRDFTQKSNHKMMIITICNYNKYQDYEDIEQPLANHKPTTSQPLANHIIRNKEIQEEKEVKDIRANALAKESKKKEFNGKDCIDIFEYWKIKMLHPQSQLIDKRKKLIQKTLDSGYTPTQIKLAIDGHNKSKWHKENGFDGIEYSLKPENIDKFIKQAGMTDEELNSENGKPKWGDWSITDGLQAEFGFRSKDIRKLS